jgi:hypothetical protein
MTLRKIDGAIRLGRAAQLLKAKATSFVRALQLLF